MGDPAWRTRASRMTQSPRSRAPPTAEMRNVAGEPGVEAETGAEARARKGRGAGKRNHQPNARTGGQLDTILLHFQESRATSKQRQGQGQEAQREWQAVKTQETVTLLGRATADIRARHSHAVQGYAGLRTGERPCFLFTWTRKPI